MASMLAGSRDNDEHQDRNDENKENGMNTQ
jgi:hypothetical protein